MIYAVGIVLGGGALMVLARFPILRRMLGLFLGAIAIFMMFLWLAEEPNWKFDDFLLWAGMLVVAAILSFWR